MMKVKHNKLKIRFDEPNDGWVATIYTYTTSDYYRITLELRDNNPKQKDYL